MVKSAAVWIILGGVPSFGTGRLGGRQNARDASDVTKRFIMGEREDGKKERGKQRVDAT